MGGKILFSHGTHHSKGVCILDPTINNNVEYFFSNNTGRIVLITTHLTHWLLELYAKMCFLDILVLFKLDLDQISFNPAENAFATQQLAFLATRIAFYHIATRACAKIKRDSFWMRKWPTSLGFSILDFFWSSFFLLFFSFAAVIDLLLGLLAAKKLLRKHHQDGQILAWSSQV